MTIRADIDRAIDAACKAGVGTASMRLRMGPTALAALAADHKAAVATLRYSDVPIEEVEAPGRQGTGEATADRFHGWELIA